MKGKLIWLLSAVTAASCLTACVPSSETNGITLTLMGNKSDLNKSYMTSIFEQYETETGNKLNIIAYEDAEFESAAMEQMKTKNAPDILLHFHNADLAQFDVENRFVALNDQSWTADLTDSARAYCTDKDGDLLGLPFWESSVSGCYYNKTILDDLGLRPATSQAEFDVLCEALSETGYTPICWPADGCSWMMQFGLDPLFADDPARLEQLNSGAINYADIPEVTGMVQWVSDAASKGWFGQNYLMTGWDDISPALASGDAVMTFIWDTWFYTDFEKDGTYTIDDFALMPVFLNTVDSGTYEGGNLNMMMVAKSSKHPKEALDFLAFCATPEHYNAAFAGVSTVSCFRGQTTNIQSKMVTDASASIAANERVSTASSQIIGYSAEDVAESFNEMFRGNITVAECVAEMDAKRHAAS